MTATALDVRGEAAHAGDAAPGHEGGAQRAADELETLVADDLWPLATYQEMLFIL